MKFLLTYPIRIVFAMLATVMLLGWSFIMFLWHLWEIPDVFNPLKADCWEFFEEAGWGEGIAYKSIWHWCFQIK